MNKHGHAVVIGGSIAGLLAARVLSEKFYRVTLIERDIFPAVGEHRKGVPQSKHAHGLLFQGRRLIEELFPDLIPELVAGGASLGDLGNKLISHHDGYHCRYFADMEGICVGRPHLEGRIRTRVLALPNLSAIENCDVNGLATSADGETITGVRLVRRSQGSAESVLEADLVVDASGRGSKLPTWLKELSYPQPEEEQVKVSLTYVTRIYKRLPEHLNGNIALVISPSADNRRGVGILASEGNVWTVTLFGYFEDAPPDDARSFVEFAYSLNAPDCYNLIKNAEPVSEPVMFKFPANRRYRYEKLDRFPEGLLAIGDVVCSFNPIYGQGMTIAATEAMVLRNLLDGDLKGIGKRFFKVINPSIDIPWSIAVGADLRLPGVEGKRTAAVNFINWYVGKLQIAARYDPKVALAFQQVVNLMAPPQALMTPIMAARIFLSNLKKGRVQTDAPSGSPAMASD
jgi:2-polyprenyl-6-methoxyphenol hydroxylase-like FAD-dependent oxidoreductase